MRIKLTIQKYIPALAVIFFFLLTGCSEDKPDPSPTPTPPATPTLKLEKISGDNQTGLLGQPLALPVKVKFQDTNGAVQTNKIIDFSIVSGGGTLSAGKVLTDQNGMAEVTWTLGSSDPVQTMKAQVLDGGNQPVTSPVAFTAREGVFTLVRVSGHNLTGYNNEELLHPVKVQLFNPDGSFGANRLIEFRVIKGNGTLRSAIVPTDQYGWAETAWTLGPTDSIQTVQAHLLDANNQPVPSTIVEFSPKVKLVFTVAGGNGKGSGANQLDDGWGMAVNAGGNVFIADRFNDRVQKWAPGATSGITVAGGKGQGSRADQLYNPHDVFVAANGDIFVADYNNGRIQKWIPGAGSGIQVAGGAVPGSASNQLHGAASVFVGVTGNIFVSEFFNDRVTKWTPGATNGVTVAGGNGQGGAGNQLEQPNGIFVDAAGNVYVADNNNSRIQKWVPGATNGVTVAGGHGDGKAANQLDHPAGVFVDAGGNIFIADTRNHRIQKWAPGATSGVTVAGSSSGGNATSQLYFPTDVYVDAQRNIYVADNGNYRVQKWLP